MTTIRRAWPPDGPGRQTDPRTVWAGRRWAETSPIDTARGGGRQVACQSRIQAPASESAAPRAQAVQSGRRWGPARVGVPRGAPWGRWPASARLSVHGEREEAAPRFLRGTVGLGERRESADVDVRAPGVDANLVGAGARSCNVAHACRAARGDVLLVRGRDPEIGARVVEAVAIDVVHFARIARAKSHEESMEVDHVCTFFGAAGGVATEQAPWQRCDCREVCAVDPEPSDAVSCEQR